MGESFTIEQWLQGMTGFDISDNTMRAILAGRGVRPCTDMAELVGSAGIRLRDLCLADTYRWLATASSSSEIYESDGGWQSRRTSKTDFDRKALMREANRLYALHGETSSIDTVKGKIRIMAL